jgi:glycosyltransferase involved in cell wall biosynthesis
MKLFRINHVVCNSKFTKGFIDKEFGVKSVVVYPPVDTESIKPRRKKKMILSVGRFSQLKQAKRQDVLVKVFKKMCDKGLKDWRLVLAGGSEVGAGEYVERLKKMADGYPIEIVEGPKYQKLLEYYGKSKIFWSASGYGVDEKKDPGGVEHFGISVVEAMAAKSVPVVFGAGGYKEIVSDGKDGLLWKNMRQLMKITQRIIKDSKELMQISERALSKSDDYSYANFERRLEAIV